MYCVSWRSTVPAMVAARISVDDGAAAAGLGGGGSAGADGTHAGVFESSFATDNSSAELAPILRDLCRLPWRRARASDRRNLRIVQAAFRSSGPPRRRRTVRR